MWQKQDSCEQVAEEHKRTKSVLSPNQRVQVLLASRGSSHDSMKEQIRKRDSSKAMFKLQDVKIQKPLSWLDRQLQLLTKINPIKTKALREAIQCKSLTVT